MTTGKTDRETGRAPAAGFTLLEIAVGMSVLIIALLGLSLAMVTAYRVERVATEKRIALAWATGQMETLRSMSYSEVLAAPNATPLPGYLVPASWPGAARAGRSLDLAPTDTTPDYFERYFYSSGTGSLGTPIILGDPALAGLQPLDRPPPDTNLPGGVMGVVSFAEPTILQNGLGDGTGYFVTIRLRWKGAAGPSEVKVASFVGR